MIQFVDSSGRLWECERASVCLTDTAVRKPPRDVQVVRALHLERKVTTEELRKARRVLVGEAFREVLRSPELEPMLGLIRMSAQRFDAAGWLVPPLPPPAQPNDYNQLLAVIRNRRARALGVNARERLREMLLARYADIAQLEGHGHRTSGVVVIREIQAAVLLELF